MRTGLSTNNSFSPVDSSQLEPYGPELYGSAPSRRNFLYQLSSGIGAVALSALLREERAHAGESQTLHSSPGAASSGALAPKPGHYPGKAKRCIFLLMEGGPSQIDTFDPKPDLGRLHMKVMKRELKLESSQTRGERWFVKSPFRFERHGECGMPVSELFNEVAGCVDDIAFVRSVQCESDNHPAALFQLTTGQQVPGSPSMGAWAIYGLGTENQNLPAFIVLRDGRPYGGTTAWNSGFLPSHFQGTQLRSGQSPVLNLKLPRAVTPETRRSNLDLLRQMNEWHRERLPSFSDLQARIDAYELAFRMQTEVPGVVDTARESAATRVLYGLDGKNTRSFGARCLLARRLVEKGVRFVQVWAGGWDSHSDILGGHRNAAARVDKPIAGLLLDLKQRGLLEETLVVWGGEFGRTPDTRDRKKPGRDHHPNAMTMWFAGGGARGGSVVGGTDDLGNEAVTEPHHLRDVHATILHLMGLDDFALTYYHGGRFKRLTDTGGDAIRGIFT